MLREMFSNGAHGMPSWVIGQMDPFDLDTIVDIMMATRVTQGYGAWWILVHQGHVDVDESDSDGCGDDQMANQPSSSHLQINLFVFNKSF